jgi:hypothetical protein
MRNNGMIEEILMRCAMFLKQSIMAGVAVVAMASFASGAVAQCLSGAAVTSPAVIASFQSDPAALLADNPDGGVSLSRAVRGLVGSDIDTLSAVMALLDEATPAQRSAIGVGLGQAAQACVAQTFEDPEAIEFAEMIQLAIAEAGYADVASAFTTVSNGIMTAAAPAAAPPAPAGPGPGPGAPGIGGAFNLGESGAPNFVANQGPPSFVSPGSGTVTVQNRPGVTPQVPSPSRP